MIKQSNTTAGRRRTGSSARRQSEEMEENPLHEAFLEELADIYNAEQQIIKALPRMAKAAQSEELREAFDEHLEETEQQAQRLEKAFTILGESMKKKKCKGMEGLLAEGKEVMEEHKGEPSLDALLIAAAQKVEHYEIASYGSICTWAEQMGHQEVLNLLKQNLSEEKAADEKMTEIAESVANLQAESK